MNVKLLCLLGLGTVFTAVWLILMRKRLSMAWYVAILIAVLHTICGVLSVKVFAFFESGSTSNMSLFGGVFFMPLLYALGAKTTKRPSKKVFDVCTPCMLLTLMCARVNCILSGCCRGLPIPGWNGFRFPTREMEILFYVVLLIILCPRIYRDELDGRAYPIYMIAYGTFRFITEFFRDAETRSLFHVAHIWALITLLLGISIYAEMRTKKPNERRRR